jgi:hypothetical protein
MDVSRSKKRMKVNIVLTNFLLAIFLFKNRSGEGNLIDYVFTFKT